MARPSDGEFALKRKIKELEEQLSKKEDEIRVLKKKIEKSSEEPKKKKALHEIRDNGCPSCGAELKETPLPFGKLVLCSKGCGHRETKRCLT